MSGSLKFDTLSSLCAAALAVSLGAAAAQPLTVVELFTSQGCSSCPPANANLIKVKDQPGVLALSFNVTYWDYLGWKDTFGRQEFTQRQVSYEPPLGHDGPFRVGHVLKAYSMHLRDPKSRSAIIADKKVDPKNIHPWRPRFHSVTAERQSIFACRRKRRPRALTQPHHSPRYNDREKITRLRSPRR